MKPTLVAFLDASAEDREAFAAHAPASWRLQFHDEAAVQPHLASLREAAVLSVFVHSRLNAAVLAQLPLLRLVATRSTGVDHIDLPACRQRGIAVCNVPEYGSATVAEHSFALLLALSRRIYEARQRTLHGSFSYRGLTGFDLQDKVLGVAGCGRIGRHVIRIAAGFGMRVLVHDVAHDAALAQELGFRYTDWNTLLASADVVSLHMPATPQNRHLMDDAAFVRMKPGAVLINTARGSLVDEAALLRALDRGHLAGAGLDVLEDEPQQEQEEAVLRCDQGACGTWNQLARQHPLMVHPRVLVTPHIGFNSREALSKIVQTTIDNIVGFLAGALRNRVA